MCVQSVVWGIRMGSDYLNSGNGNTATTWTCEQIPTAAYDAIIENGHTVTLPNGYQGETMKLDVRGELKQGVGAGVRVSN